LSYRNLEEMMLEKGLTVDHSTVYRWVQVYAPELAGVTQLSKKASLHYS
jgi:transposase-like protein